MRLLNSSISAINHSNSGVISTASVFSIWPLYTRKHTHKHPNVQLHQHPQAPNLRLQFKALSVAFDAAHREGIIPVNPVKALKRPSGWRQGGA